MAKTKSKLEVMNPDAAGIDIGSVCPEKVKMFSGSQTHQDKSRSPVARVAMWRETKMLKPTDNVIVG